SSHSFFSELFRNGRFSLSPADRCSSTQPTFRSKSSGPAFFSHSSREIRVPRQADEVSRGSSRRARRVTGEERQSFAPSRLRVRLAITPTHPQHTANRSTRSLFQDGIVLLRKVGTRIPPPNPPVSLLTRV